jgi:hypothetical protein
MWGSGRARTLTCTTASMTPSAVCSVHCEEFQHRFAKICRNGQKITKLNLMQQEM